VVLAAFQIKGALKMSTWYILLDGDKEPLAPPRKFLSEARIDLVEREDFPNPLYEIKDITEGEALMYAEKIIVRELRRFGLSLNARSGVGDAETSRAWGLREKEESQK
jgi:hypothetical protein